MSDTPKFPAPQKRRTERDLARAEWLRPRDVFELYGIPASTLGNLCTQPTVTNRPPSRMIRGRGGRKGIRLFKRKDFEAWLESWSDRGEFTPKAA